MADVTALHGEIDHAVSCFGAWWQGGELLPVCVLPYTLCSTWHMAAAGQQAWHRRRCNAHG